MEVGCVWLLDVAGMRFWAVEAANYSCHSDVP